MSTNIRAGIYGASGYMGGEVLRILNEHPNVTIAWATSRSGKPIEDFHRNLYGSGLELSQPGEIKDVDVVFVAAPTGVASEVAQQAVPKGIKVIDLGSDFRLTDQTTWQRIYGTQHTAWDIASQAVYGIVELHRDAIKQASVIANPGCFSSAAILGLAPLIKAGMIDTQKIVIDGLSGTAGAGAELDTTMHHPEIANNIVAYNVVDHRHTYEMEQELSALSNDDVTINFTSSYVPISRGILSIAHAFPMQATSRDELLKLYKEFYQDEYFIKIFDMPRDPEASWQYKPYPWVSAVSGTNFCHIGMDYDEARNRIVVFSVLDSVGKGGAHVGVQNMNLMFGLDETTGLTRLGAHPY